MGVAALTISFPGDGAPPRFALALAASAFAHFFLAQSLVFDVPWRAAQPAHAGMMTVRFAAPAPSAAEAPEPPRVAAWTGSGAVEASRRRADAPGVHLRQDAVTPLALPQAPDPTFYSARDLDVFPRPAVPLDLDRLGPAGGSAVGRFRVMLLIDEGGTVNEIEFTEADPPGRLQKELRALLAATRFFPGQKDGRAVKSRVVLSVTLDPARGESAPNR